MIDRFINMLRAATMAQILVSDPDGVGMALTGVLAVNDAQQHVVRMARARILELEDALAPFAEAAELIPDRYEGGDDWPIVNNTRVTKQIVMGDLLRAKALANREVES